MRTLTKALGVAGAGALKGRRRKPKRSSADDLIRAGRWVRTHPWVIALAAFVYLWSRAGLLGAVAMSAGFTIVVMAAWFTYRSKVTGFTVAQSVDELRQRRKLARMWPKACADAGLKTVPRLRRVNGIEGGLTADVYAPPVEALSKQVRVMAERVGVRSITVVPKGHAGWARLEFYSTDPLGRVLPLKDLPKSPPGTIAYGVRQDGSPAHIQQELSVLIGGLTRHGKSNSVRALLADLVRKDVPVDLYVSDAKGGIELKVFGLNVGRQFGCLRVVEYVTDAASTVAMVKRAEKALRARQAAQKATKHTPTKDSPLTVLLLDELLPLGSMLRKGTDSELGRLLFEGAASGFVVWANAQVGHVSEIGAIRKLIPQRICFATPDWETTDTILGSHAEANGAGCSRVRVRGVGFSNTDHSYRPEQFRAALVTDTEAKDLALGKVPREMLAPAVKEEPIRPCVVYRLYSAQGELLYVGITNNLARRLEEHADSQPWWDEVLIAATRTQWFDTESRARAVETEAIRAELPRYNTVSNHRNPLRRVLLKAGR